MTAPDGLAVEVSGLSKAYARTQVLRDLDLRIPWGRVLTVLGPNGSARRRWCESSPDSRGPTKAGSA